MGYSKHRLGSTQKSFIGPGFFVPTLDKAQGKWENIVANEKPRRV